MLSRFFRMLPAALVVHCSSHALDSGSQTHWFDLCASDHDCPTATTCQCGICTRSCDTAADCSAAPRASHCTGTTSAAHVAQCGSSADRVCLPACAGGCNASERCVDGACIIAPPTVDAGAGGKGGAPSTMQSGGAPATGGKTAGGTPDSGNEVVRDAGSDAPVLPVRCALDEPGERLASPLCPFAPGLPFNGTVSGTVTAIGHATVCSDQPSVAPVDGDVLTIETPGTAVWHLELALGDISEPFSVGDRIDIAASKPEELRIQQWPTISIMKSGVVVVYTTRGTNTTLPPPLTLERGDAVCHTDFECAMSTVQTLRATADGTTVEIPPHSHADVGEYRVYDISVFTGTAPVSPCPVADDYEHNQLNVAIVRRTPVAASDAGGH